MSPRDRRSPDSPQSDSTSSVEDLSELYDAPPLEELRLDVDCRLAAACEMLVTCRRLLDTISEKTEHNRELIEQLESIAEKETRRVGKLEESSRLLRQQMDERELSLRASNVVIMNSGLDPHADDANEYVSDLLKRWRLDPTLIVYCRFLASSSTQPIIHAQFKSIGAVSDLLARRRLIEQSEGVVVKRDMPAAFRKERKVFGKFLNFLQQQKQLDTHVFRGQIYVGSAVLCARTEIPQEEQSWEQFYDVKKANLQGNTV